MNDDEVKWLDGVLRSAQEWMFAIIEASQPQPRAKMSDVHAARTRLVRELTRERAGDKS
jgi:hypothetical protein